jgi:SAM-dependent methyltransferase
LEKRNGSQRFADFVTFPFRALTLFDDDRWGLSSLASERFDYAAREVVGHCLDVGCGDNRFVREYLAGRGQGVDILPYAGLAQESVIPDLTHFPHENGSFDSVTFIANLNHVPEPQRDAELGEAYRVLRPGGNIVVTMGNPLAEILVHKLVALYDRVFKTHYDHDSHRGMHEDEDYYLTDVEIRKLLTRAGFQRIRKKRFWTQWGLNHLLVGWKP